MILNVLHCCRCHCLRPKVRLFIAIDINARYTVSWVADTLFFANTADQPAVKLMSPRWNKNIYISWLYSWTKACLQKQNYNTHNFEKSTVLLCCQVAFGFQNQFWCGHHCLKWTNNEDVLPWIVFRKIYTDHLSTTKYHLYNPWPRCTQQWVWMMKPPSIIYIYYLDIFFHIYININNIYIIYIILII